MKKILALLLALTMIFALAACGKKAESAPAPAAEAAPAAEPAAEAPAVKAGFIFLHDENSTYDLNFINAAKEACEKLGVEYLLKTGIPEGQECADAAEELIDEGCNFIFADSSATSPSCSRSPRSILRSSSATPPAPRPTPPALPTTTTASPPSTRAASSAASPRASSSTR